MGLTRLEQETGILWNQFESDAIIWSTSPQSIRKFTKLFGEGKKKGTFCFEWKIPKIELRITKRRKMSEAHKKALGLALSKGRKRKGD